MPETKKCGFACLNTVNPHVGHFILELCLTAMLSTQRFQFGFIVFAGLAMPHVVRSNNRMWRPQHNNFYKGCTITTWRLRARKGVCLVKNRGVRSQT